jgi:hypothetical protein
MPWTAAEAKTKTKKADTPEKQKKWAKIANAALKQYGDTPEALPKLSAPPMRPWATASGMAISLMWKRGWKDRKRTIQQRIRMELCINMKN